MIVENVRENTKTVLKVKAFKNWKLWEHNLHNYRHWKHLLSGNININVKANGMQFFYTKNMFVTCVKCHRHVFLLPG